MYLRPSVFTTLLFLLPSFAFAIGAYKVGDKLIVHAQSGLILRQTAAPEGEKLATLAYGDEVTVSKIDLPRVAHTVEEFPGFKINGNWVWVKTKAGQEGFVFDGYLSAYPIPGKVIEVPEGENYSVSELYMLSKTAKKGVRLNLPKIGGQYENYRQVYKNGATVVFAGGEGGSSQSITFEKGITIEEAYLIGKGLWLKDMKVKASYKKFKIIVKSEDELWQITVEMQRDVPMLTMSHAD